MFLLQWQNQTFVQDNFELHIYSAKELNLEGKTTFTEHVTRTHPKLTIHSAVILMDGWRLRVSSFWIETFKITVFDRIQLNDTFHSVGSLFHHTVGPNVIYTMGNRWQFYSFICMRSKYLHCLDSFGAHIRLTSANMFKQNHLTSYIIRHTGKGNGKNRRDEIILAKGSTMLYAFWKLSDKWIVCF